jgi:uncharacterized protein (DUF433 family)
MIEEYLEEYPVSYKCPRVTIKKGRCDGLPCVRGTDITTKSIAILAHNGLNQDEVLNMFPQLTIEDLRDVYIYYQGPSFQFLSLELDQENETEKVFL